MVTPVGRRLDRQKARNDMKIVIDIPDGYVGHDMLGGY